MHSLLRAALVAVAASVLAHAHAGDDLPVRRRKSLGFGPVHPRAAFISSPDQIPTGFTASLSDDPIHIARDFVTGLLRSEAQLSEESSFTVRKDSYTDDTTGVTHVYFRQLINGLEVSDGDINVNVKDGAVLSYGDSFYRGDVPVYLGSPAKDLQVANPLKAHCDALQTNMPSLRSPWTNQLAEQTVLGSQPPMSHEDGDALLRHLYTTNCIGTNFGQGFLSAHPAIFAYQSESVGDSRHAVLQFMLAATPNPAVFTAINSCYLEHIEQIQSHFEHHFVGTQETPVEYLHNVPDTVNPVKAKLAYVQIPHGDSTVLSLVWKLEVEMQDNWYEAAVTAHYPHEIVSVVDWASDSPFAPVPKDPSPPKEATYNVFAWGTNDPEGAERSLEKENYDPLASPLGWHSFPAANDPSVTARKRKNTEELINSTTTWGNNVFAHENWEGRNAWIENFRPDAGSGLVFNFSYNPTPTNSTDALAEAKKYINTTITQLFYTSNLVHDLYYRYGFDEKSGNFQQHNFGRGGEENDAVIANAQDGSGYNNANFMTPPDGQNGRCRMYLWNTANPYRDGDLEAGIVIHELSHGLSTRLTGGPANSGCLGWGESGGMGEGWGDFLATTIRSNRNYSDYAMGAWAANRVTGIRNYVYSLNETINPSTYKILDKPGYWGVHAIGEVWAEMLWIVSNRLIAKHGYTDSLFPPAPLENGTVPEGDFYRPAEYTSTGERKPLVPKHGNSLTVQLVLNGMKLQQCRPSFFDARNAIIQADQVLTGGENFCLMWNAFSERGLGEDARIDGQTPWGGGIRMNGFKSPLACHDVKEPKEPKDGDVDDSILV